MNYNDNNASLTQCFDGSIQSYLRDLVAQEKWFVQPFHHVQKRVEDPISVGVMSHHGYAFSSIALGHLSLYHKVNRDANCPGIADRICVYEPISSQNGSIKPGIELVEPLVTMERQIPLHTLDLICVSLTNPDAITTILGLFRLGAVPLTVEQRRIQGGPVILAGGPGCQNPEPFVDFFDLFCIGDGRTVTAAVVRAIHALGRADANAGNIFHHVGPITGLYVPTLYRFTFAGNSVKDVKSLGAPLSIKAAIDPPEEWAQASLFASEGTAVIVPNYGCKHRCSYCQISEIPYQQFEIAPLLNRVKQYFAAGVRTLIINSATLTQHSEAEHLLDSICDEIRSSNEDIKVYIGSMRFDEVSDSILARMSELGAFSHTYLLYTDGGPQKYMALAPEHGSNDLMRRLHRKVDPWRVLDTVDLAGRHGVNNFVLYFVVGFESETSSDRKQISALVAALLDRTRHVNGKVILKINPLIPTPSTVCQRMAMLSIDEYHQCIAEIQADLVDRIGLLRFEKQVEIVPLAKERLVIEAIINRADRRVGPMIRRLAELRLTGVEPNSEQLLEWLNEYGFDWQLLSGQRTTNEVLPWSIVDQTLFGAEQKVLLDTRFCIDL